MHIIRWLEYTRRKIQSIVVARHGFVIWAKASEPAFRSGRFIRTKGVPPVEVPTAALVHRKDIADIAREGNRSSARRMVRRRAARKSMHSTPTSTISSRLNSALLLTTAPSRITR